jgi:hypothetical protein
MGATEDAASRRPARPDGPKLRFETSSETYLDLAVARLDDMSANLAKITLAVSLAAEAVAVAAVFLPRR